jgi:hypothetical protein
MAATRVTVAATSAIVPRTSPVMPRSSAHQVPLHDERAGQLGDDG